MGHERDVLEILADNTARKTGEAFFTTLVEQLTIALDVACALVTETVDTPATRVKTLAVCTTNGLRDNFELDLEGTPCQQTIRGHATFFPQRVQVMFPKCDTLSALNAESYCGFPFYDTHGEVIGHLVIIDDKQLPGNFADGPLLKIFATRAAAELERVRIERRLRNSEKQLRQILNTTLDAIIVIDQDGRIREWNPQAENVFGWPREQAVGRLVHETVIPERLRLKHLDGLERFLETGESQLVGRRLEVVGFRHDGTEFPAELTVSQIYDGQQTCFAAFVRDLTAEKESAAQLRQTQDKLAHVSRLCTLGEMVTGVAHELTQPLASISNYAYVLENSEDRSIVSASITDIRDQAHRAGEIVRRFRSLAAKSKPQRAKCDPNTLVLETLALVKADLDLSQIEVVLDCSRQLPEFHIDEIQIQQMVLNLLRNAIEALVAEPNGSEKVITIHTLQTDDQIEVAVEDNGPGVAIHNVFDAFVSTKEYGMGMGLAISRSIVESHGGRMWIAHAADPKITRFQFKIPIDHESHPNHSAHV